MQTNYATAGLTGSEYMPETPNPHARVAFTLYHALRVFVKIMLASSDIRQFEKAAEKAEREKRVHGNKVSRGQFENGQV